jgi:hypothetical protein
MVMGAVWVLCEFSLLESQQNYILDSTRWYTEACSEEEECFSEAKNVKLCEGQGG